MTSRAITLAIGLMPKGTSVTVIHGRKFKLGRTGVVLGEARMTYRFKPYQNGYTDRQTWKVWVKWDDGSGADMVDVLNLSPVSATSMAA